MPATSTNPYDIHHLAQLTAVSPETIHTLQADNKADTATIDGSTAWAHEIVRSLTAQPNTQLPTVIDLFSGCGGMSLGFQLAGFNVLKGYDNWPCAVDTYTANLDHHAEILDLGNTDATTQRLKTTPPPRRLIPRNRRRTTLPGLLIGRKTSRRRPGKPDRKIRDNHHPLHAILLRDGKCRTRNTRSRLQTGSHQHGKSRLHHHQNGAQRRPVRSTANTQTTHHLRLPQPANKHTRTGILDKSSRREANNGARLVRPKTGNRTLLQPTPELSASSNLLHRRTLTNHSRSQQADLKRLPRTPRRLSIHHTGTRTDHFRAGRNPNIPTRIPMGRLTHQH